MIKRFWTIFIARNKEYYRDKAAFGWNFIFPFLIISGFSVIFQRGGELDYKIGVIPAKSNDKKSINIKIDKKDYKFFTFIDFNDPDIAFDKLIHHKIDLIIEKNSMPVKYWITDTSPKGIVAESLLLKKLYEKKHVNIKKESIQGVQIDYLNWFFPGIISMSMMFSALFGVGYTIVRYRKNGVLKRLNATPLTAFEFLSAQIASRLFLIISTNTLLFIGCIYVFDFSCLGSYIELLIFFSLGTISIISLGLIVAARIASEELAHGVLNFFTWPMMFLSEVWFSLEGAPLWLKNFSNILPLTHVTNGLRKIMNEGATLSMLGYESFILILMSIIFIMIGSLFFKWT